MTQTRNPYPLRLRKKHGTGEKRDITPADGERLVRGQSVGNAIAAGVIAIGVFCLLWILVSTLSNRVFPWMTVVLGVLVGIAIRRAGRGVDWRFPVLAGGLALVGSVLANVVVAASTTAEAFGTGTLHILQAVTTMTWPVFFEEVWNAADTFYATVGAAFAAFFANRRLSRAEFYALRIYRAKSDGHQ